MNDIKRGDIYWISSSVRDNTVVTRFTEKTRPAIIVSNDTQNKFSGNVEIVFLTTSPKIDLPTHCTIRSCQEISTALCESICTIEVEQIGNYIGTLTEAEMGMVDNCLLISLGIDHTPIKESLSQAEEDPDKDDCRKVTDSYEYIRRERDFYIELYNNLLNKILAK